ncbi:hypothetical protein SAMN05444166_6185 [Singulisphaera sp. GP187]|nr:hypothetical protein SAMN05444166_6185 [Singulisphaera sp. GP187]
MNPIERIKNDIAVRHPGLAISLDRPIDENGPWFLDVHRKGGRSPVVVEWRPERGFGVSTPSDDDYGSGPDEVYGNVKAATDRVAELIRTEVDPSRRKPSG